MTGLLSRDNRRSLWGQTVLMLAILAAVLAVLWLLTSPHYFKGALTVCYGFVIGWFAGWLARRGQAANRS